MQRPALLLIILSATALHAAAQTVTRLSGEVTAAGDTSIPGAVVTLRNPLTRFSESQTANDRGTFSFVNIPLGEYQLAVSKDGFAAWQRTIALRSPVPVNMGVKLEIATQRTAVEVNAAETIAALDVSATGTRTELNQAAIEYMPRPVGTRGLEAVLLSFPGFAADANGAIHPRGAHNQMSYIVDGMPIRDQLTGAFANGIDAQIVENIQLFTGNIPAEYGGKISAVANIVTKSGIGSGRRFFGSISESAAQFDTLSHAVQAGGDYGRWGFFTSASVLQTHRFLDQVSFDNTHNGGNAERLFTRIDYHQSDRNLFRLNLLAGRSSFELANLRSQQALGQDQRQLLRDVSAAFGWTRVLSPTTTLDLTASYRTTIGQLFSSAGDTPVTAAQARHLTTAYGAARFHRVQGRLHWYAGAEYERFPVSENFSFGITHPGFNDPADSGYVPTLSEFDLSRGGRLFHFSKKAAGGLASAFAQEEARLGRLTLTAGIRFDEYRFLVDGRHAQPRVGAAYHIQSTGTVLRASYNRLFQTPVNENLLLSNSEEASVLVPSSIRTALGQALIRIRPERQDFWELGLQQTVTRAISLNGSYYQKRIRDLHDNNNFLDTGVIFPTSLREARARGAEMRINVIPWRGLSGSLSATHYNVVVTPPFTGGLFLGQAAVAALSSGPFIIDHDQALGMQANAVYQTKRHYWISASVRYDSGLVTNPSDPAAVAQDPDYADLLRYVSLESNPPRVKPRMLVDVAAGYERMREGRRRWDAQVQVVNIFDRAALYNFQSIFVGTRLVAPRTVGATWRWYW